MRIARERLARSRRPLLVRRRHRGRQLRGREQLALRGDGGDGLGELLGLLRRGDDHLGVRVGVGGGGDSGGGWVSEWMGKRGGWGDREAGRRTRESVEWGEGKRKMYALLRGRVLEEERGELGLGDRGEARVRPAHVALPVRVLRDVGRCPNYQLHRPSTVQRSRTLRRRRVVALRARGRGRPAVHALDGQAARDLRVHHDRIA